MPSPEVQYTIDGSFQFGHIGGDTHFYMMEIDREADKIVDDYHSNNSNEILEADSNRRDLVRMAEHFENHYISWRQANRSVAKYVSYEGLKNLPETVRGAIVGYADILYREGYRTLSEASKAYLAASSSYFETKAVTRRMLMRARDDLPSIEAIEEAQQQSKIQRQTFNSVCNAATNLVINDASKIFRQILTQRTAEEKKKVQQMLRKRAAEEKKIIKRSVKFLSRLIGSETTRMFIGGDSVRFEGNHAIYEIKKKSSLMDSHGGFRALSIYSKEHPDVQLCSFCIYTDKVPLLDHVANLIMHIQAGEEEEILKIGNARDIHDDAYDLPWLAPHLPEKHKEFDLSILNLFGHSQSESSLRHEKICIDRLRKALARDFYETVLCEFSDLIRNAHLDFTISPQRFRTQAIPITNSTGSVIPMIVPDDFEGTISSVRIINNSTQLVF